MFQPVLAPLGSLWLSALVAMLPLAAMFLFLGVLRWKAHLAGGAALLVALAVAILAFRMPVDLALLAATQGAAFGIFPITFIVLTAVWFYEITVVSGRFEDLRATFSLISDDPRILAILIAFCFGGMLEALAGFGAPVAITGVMLMTIGFPPVKAAVTVLLANTAPVAFGAVAIPILTAGTLTGIDYHLIGAYTAAQTATLSWFVPLLLLFVVDGRRGVREVWPVALVVGISFAVGKWVCANYISTELTDVVASLAGLAAGVLFMRVWKPRGTAAAVERLEGLHAEEAAAGFVSTADIEHNKTVRRPTPAQVGMALVPYLIVIAIFTVAKLVPVVANALTATDIHVGWPGLDGRVMTVAGTLSTSTVYHLTWLSSPGTLLIVSGILTAIVYRVPAAKAWDAFLRQLHRLRWTFATIASVLGLAYVMNLSGQTINIGTWIAGTGAVFAFLAPILGWIGTAVTGSDTSANALFATLQQTAAQNIGIDPPLLVAANTSGGAIGKLISPQNLAIAATAVGLIGKESDILRRSMPWSLALLALLCLLVGLQSTPVLSWMLPS